MGEEQEASALHGDPQTDPVTVGIEIGKNKLLIQSQSVCACTAGMTMSENITTVKNARKACLVHILSIKILF
jgi:hypothetical protein